MTRMKRGLLGILLALAMMVCVPALGLQVQAAVDVANVSAELQADNDKVLMTYTPAVGDPITDEVDLSETDPAFDGGSEGTVDVTVTEDTLSGLALTDGSNGMQLSWEKVEGIGYVIYKNDAFLTTITNPDTTDYTDADVTYGTKYTYKVSAITVAADTTDNEIDVTINSDSKAQYHYTNTPVLTGVENVASGVKVKWNAVSGVTKYAVFRKTDANATSWTHVGSTSGTSFVDKNAVSGTTYYYTVRAYSDSTPVSAYDTTGLSIEYIAAPNVSAVSNTASGVKVTWGAVNGASKYAVFRKTDANATAWKRLAITSGTSYVDGNVKAGTTYYYTARVMNDSESGYVSGYNATGKSIKYTATAPVLETPVNTASGIQVKWKAAVGVTKYAVFRKTDSSATKWTAIGTSTTTSYLDKNTTAGKTYYYTVRPISSDGTAFVGSFNNNGVSKKYTAAAPAISNIYNIDGGVKLTWKSVHGVSTYYVYRKTDPNSTSWTRIGTTTGLYFEDKTAVSSTKYYYTVKGVNTNPDYATSFDRAGKTITYLAKPGTIKTEKISSGVEITWPAQKAATKYILYRRLQGDSWSEFKTVTTNSYTDTSVVNGKVYYYSVRSIAADGSRSVVNTPGTQFASLANVAVSTTINGGDGVVVRWNKVDSADGYYIYRKTGSGSYSKIGTASKAATYYTDKTVENGKKYTYYVRAYRGDSLSTYTAGNQVYVLTGVKLSKITPVSSSSIKITWEKKDNVTGYLVYRKGSTGSYCCIKKIANPGRTYYVDNNVKKGETYTYTVKPYRVIDGTTHNGCYDSKGLNLKLTWTRVNSGSYYIYKDSNGNRINDVTKIVNAGSYSIRVNKTNQVVTVFATVDGVKTPVIAFACSSGAVDGNTPDGTYRTPAKYRWHELMGPCWGQWDTRITNSGVLFHSVFYNSYNNNNTLSVRAYNKLGRKASHGCVRLNCQAAKWIYDNCSLGTSVTIGHWSSDPLTTQPTYQLESWHTWDPTDPNMMYKCEQKGCH